MWRERDWVHCQTYDEHGSRMWMDALHVRMIYDFVMANDFKLILEIGCWDGFSTSALVQAARDLKDFRFIVCDVSIRKAVRDMCDGMNACLLEMPSVDALQIARGVDLVILDGDHHLQAVQADWRILRQHGVRTIVAHDVGPRGDRGPQWLLEELQGRDDWRLWVDQRERPSQWTDRGLMIATCDPAVVPPPPCIVELTIPYWVAVFDFSLGADGWIERFPFKAEDLNEAQISLCNMAERRLSMAPKPFDRLRVSIEDHEGREVAVIYPPQ